MAVILQEGVLQTEPTVEVGLMSISAPLDANGLAESGGWSMASGSVRLPSISPLRTFSSCPPLPIAEFSKDLIRHEATSRSSICTMERQARGALVRVRLCLLLGQPPAFPKPPPTIAPPSLVRLVPPPEPNPPRPAEDDGASLVDDQADGSDARTTRSDRTKKKHRHRHQSDTADDAFPLPDSSLPPVVDDLSDPLGSTMGPAGPTSPPEGAASAMRQLEPALLRLEAQASKMQRSAATLAARDAAHGEIVERVSKLESALAVLAQAGSALHTQAAQQREASSRQHRGTAAANARELVQLAAGLAETQANLAHKNALLGMQLAILCRGLEDVRSSVAEAMGAIEGAGDSVGARSPAPKDVGSELQPPRDGRRRRSGVAGVPKLFEGQPGDAHDAGAHSSVLIEGGGNGTGRATPQSEMNDLGDLAEGASSCGDASSSSSSDDGDDCHSIASSVSETPAPDPDASRQAAMARWRRIHGSILVLGTVGKAFADATLVKNVVVREKMGEDRLRRLDSIRARRNKVSPRARAQTVHSSEPSASLYQDTP